MAFVDEDFDETAYPSAPAAEGLVHWSSSGTVPSTGRNYTVHVGSLHSGLPGTFSFQLPQEGDSPKAMYVVAVLAKWKFCGQLSSIAIE